MKPRCALEALALNIFQEHTKDLPKGSFLLEQSGAEWWTLVLDAEPPKLDAEDNEDHDEVGMHFDADYGLEDQAPGLLLHPRVATITYLSNVGAPTLVLDRKSPPPNEAAKLAGEIRRGWLSGPRLGKHVAFDGSLLHGAPATFFPGVASLESLDEPPNKKRRLESGAKDVASALEEPRATDDRRVESQRITFLVNVWLNHCPMDAELLDDEIIEQLKTQHDKKWGLSIESPDHLDKKSLDVCPEDPAGEEETVICGHVVTLFYNEKMEKQHAASQAVCKEGKSYELEFSAGSLLIVVGEQASKDEEVEDD
jgi:hypothetical protein